jgi:hypothetical protein
VATGIAQLENVGCLGLGSTISIKFENLCFYLEQWSCVGRSVSVKIN